jgi:hypothetical protein
MPQAADEDRAKMAEYFGGDGINDGPPARFMISQGWTCEPGFLWRRTFSGEKPTTKELDCLYFLCDEWDYGYEGTAFPNDERNTNGER